MRVGAAAFLVLLPHAARAVELGAIETIALRFEAAPGTAYTYQLFNGAALNDAGEVLFWADVSSGGRGLWWWTGSGEESFVALTGEVAPGFATVPLDTIGYFSLTADGPVFFGLLERVEGVTATTDDVVYAASSSGDLVRIAREDDLAPGLGGAKFGSQLFDQSSPVSSDFGTLFHNRSEPAGGGFGDNCLWRYDGSVTTLIAIEGDFAPDASGNTFRGFFGSVMNDLGVTLTHVRLDPFGSALYRFGDGPPQLVAIEGMPAPGTGTNLLKATENRDELGINDAGDVAYLGSLEGGGSAIFAPDSAGGTRVLVRTGDPAPGTAGAEFSFPDDIALGADGSMVIEGQLTVGVGGTTTFSDSGLWGTAGYGPLQRIAREGDQPAGLVAGSTFGANPRWELNGSGEVIISGTYTAPGEGTGDGLWHHDLYSGVTSLLLRKGDVVEVAPGDLRTITFLSALGRAAGGQDGRTQAWNDAGQIAATLTFSDNTRGVFRLSVPEPATGAGAAAFAALVALRRSRRR
jgi:hypothetical protein